MTDTRDESLLAGYRGIVCDLDGVVYRGAQAVPDAIEALTTCAAAGLPIVFATNNASRLPATVADQLRGLGLRVTDQQVLTSSQASAAELARRFPPGTPVLCIGGEGVPAAVAEAGLTAVRPGRGERCEAVLQGYGPGVTAADLTEASRQVAAGALWVATNPDRTLPHEWGLGPGCGAFQEVVRIATGRAPDLVVGKPFPPLYLEAARRLDAPPASLLALGDRLDTDIDGAAAAGLDSVWVLTGVDTLADLIADPRRAVPTYLMTTLRGLAGRYRPARPADTGQVCHGVRVALRRNGVHCEWEIGGTPPSDPGERADAVLRAGAAVLLAARDAGADREFLVEAARRLPG